MKKYLFVLFLLILLTSISYSDDFELYKAAERGDIKTIKILLNKGVNIHSQQHIGGTPLMAATRAGHANTVIFLLEHGADINKGDHFGATPLSCAAGKGHIEIVKLLLDRGARFDNEALMSAAYGGHNNIVKLLLDKGALLDKGTLMAAAQGGHADTFIFLVKRGARLDSEIIFTFLIVQIEKNVLWMLILLFLLIGLLFRKKIIKKVEAQKAEVLSSDSKKEIKSQENL